VVGKNGFKRGYDPASLIQMVPEFISDFTTTPQSSEVIGKFHLNQVYDLDDWPSSSRFSVLE
jgi:hypothetical protein